MPECIYNSHCGNGVPAMLPFSVVQLKGKHCRKPHCRNGIVDTFELRPCFFKRNIGVEKLYKMLFMDALKP